MIQVAIDKRVNEFWVADLRFCKGNVRCHFKGFWKTRKGAIRWAEKQGYEVVNP